MRLCSWALLVVFLLVITEQSLGVIILSQNDAPNLVAPTDDPGWANVGRHGAAAAVYLKDGWAITANHNNRVAEITFGGTPISVQRGSEIVLQNPPESDLSTLTDLRLVRLALPPDLPKLTIADVPPRRGEDAIFIGRGRDRASDLTHWNVTPKDNVWTETADSDSDHSGFKLLTTQRKRWGTNTILDADEVDSDDYIVLDDRLIYQGSVDVVSMATRFDQNYSIPSESHGTRGDSGGGLFVKREEHWELAGIMFTATAFEGQPNETAVFGNILASADLSYYQDQIEAAIRLPWLRPGDANTDLQFDQLDLVKVLAAGKYLTGKTATWGDGDWLASGGNVEFLPVGNGIFDQLDIVASLQSDNYLNGPYAGYGTIPVPPASPSQSNVVRRSELLVDEIAAETIDLVAVPEPGTSMLLISIFVSLMVFNPPRFRRS